MIQTTLETKEYLKTTENKIRQLLYNHPELIDNPKQLVKAYWEEYDNLKVIGNWEEATTPETITRLLRMLTEGTTPEFQKSIRTDKERKTKEAEFKKLFKPA